MREGSYSIAKWATETFGPTTPMRAGIRAQQELTELLVKLERASSVADDRQVALECADVVIVLARLSALCGYDVFELVDEKMHINRQREWVLDGRGCGQHVKG